MRLAAAAPLVLAAAGVAGCSSASHTTTTIAARVPVPKVQAAILALTRRRGLAARSVSCPSTMPAQAGRVSRCVARYWGGGSGQYDVRQKDLAGDVHLSAAAMIAPEIEDTIRRGLRRGSGAGIKCPPDVPIRVGRVFHCTARSRRAVLRFRVWITDADAGYRVGTD